MKEFLKTAVRGTAIALVALTLAWTGPVKADAAVRTAHKGDSIDVLLRNLHPRSAGQRDLGCDYPVQYQLWSPNGAKDADPTRDAVMLLLPVGNQTEYRIAVTFDATGDINTFTGDAVGVYVIDDGGKIVQVFSADDPKLPDSPCTLFEKHTI